MKSKTNQIKAPQTPSAEIAIESNQTELEIIDEILESKLAGEINGYRNLLTDTTVIGTWTQRQSALVQLERQVIPADPENEADVEAAEFIKAQLESLGFDKILKAMQWGVYYGYAVGEVMWGNADGKITIADILVRDRGKFKFDKDKQLVFTGNNAETLMPDAKFWTFSGGGDTTDNPYGLGLAHFLFWAVLFKKSNIKFWLLGLEKASTSVPHVQYDPRAKDVEKEKRKALQAGVSIKNGSAIATAQGTVVELLKGVSGTEDYETLCRYMDEAIALVVLGQVMTSQAVGGQYKGEIQNQVKEDIIKADADLLCSSFNNTVIKWLTAWNFPNANPPKLWLLTEDEIDNLTKAGMYEKMANVGYRPTLATVEETFGGEWEAVGSEGSIDKQTADDEGDEPVDEFADGDIPDHDKGCDCGCKLTDVDDFNESDNAIDEIDTFDPIDKLMQFSDREIAHIIHKETENLLQISAEKREQLADTLLDTFPNLSFSELQDFLYKAIFIARVAGEVEDEEVGNG